MGRNQLTANFDEKENRLIEEARKTLNMSRYAFARKAILTFIEEMKLGSETGTEEVGSLPEGFGQGAIEISY